MDDQDATRLVRPAVARMSCVRPGEGDGRHHALLTLRPFRPTSSLRFGRASHTWTTPRARPTANVEPSGCQAAWTSLSRDSTWSGPADARPATRPGRSPVASQDEVPPGRRKRRVRDLADAGGRVRIG